MTAVASHSNSREIILYWLSENPCKQGIRGADQNRTGVRGLSPVGGCSRPDETQLSIEDWPANDDPWQAPDEPPDEPYEQEALDG